MNERYKLNDSLDIQDLEESSNYGYIDLIGVNQSSIGTSNVYKEFYGDETKDTSDFEEDVDRFDGEEVTKSDDVLCRSTDNDRMVMTMMC